MKTAAMGSIIIIAGLLLLAGLAPGTPLYNLNWALLSVVLLGLALLGFFMRFEKSGAGTRDIALVATLASLAAVARIPFAAVVSLQPTTFIVMITGYVFGARAGFMVGALAALVSNFFLGQGPWTPWQMFAWGLCGASAALAGGKRRNEFSLVYFAILCGLWGYLFGWIMNLWHWLGFIYPLTLETFIATYAISFPFDTIHAVGNVVFSIMLGRSFYQILNRFREKLFGAPAV